MCSLAICSSSFMNSSISYVLPIFKLGIHIRALFSLKLLYQKMNSLTTLGASVLLPVS